MTENEAIEWLAEETSPTLIHVAEMKKENPMEYINEAVKVACDALEEIQQYRAIGTVEELVNTQIREKVLNVELESYKEIGTIEEFKDLKLKEHNYDNCHNYTCRKKCKKDGYADAIDEFAEKIKELSEVGEISVFGWNRIVDEIAEQMKGGVRNERAMREL